jgi:MFS family permease
MGKDLALVGVRFNWALTVFYIIYIFVEVPSNIVLKRVGAKFWIPFLVFSFGVVSIGTAFVHNFDQLMVVRALLGLVEGGTMPGISFFLSTFYKREELLFRIGMFVSGSSMAGAFGGLLASGLSKIPRWGAHTAPLYMWRNIFFFEGLITVIIAMAAPFFMPDRPETCSFLTERQRMIAAERLVREHKAVREPNWKRVAYILTPYAESSRTCQLEARTNGSLQHSKHSLRTRVSFRQSLCTEYLTLHAYAPSRHGLHKSNSGPTTFSSTVRDGLRRINRCGLGK